MNIISFIDSHTSSAALICDDKIEVLIAKIYKKKGQVCYPKKSIDYCLKVLGKKT